MVLEERVKYEKYLKDRWGWFFEGKNDAELDEELNTMMVLENSMSEMVEKRLVPANWLNSMKQYTQMLDEGMNDEQILSEAPQVSSMVGDYVLPKILLPTIRRVVPELLANQIVSVQPLSAPTALIYYLNWIFSNSKGNVTAKDELSYNPQQTSPAYSAYYSSEKIGPFSATVTDATADLTISDDVTAHTPEFLTNEFVFKRIEIRDTTKGTTLLIKNAEYKKTSDTADNTYATFSTSSGVMSFGTYGTYTVESGDVVVTSTALTALGAEADDTIKVFLVYDQERTKNIPELEFTFEHMGVEVKERKLKARWTREAEQDTAAYHRLSVEQELVKVQATEMAYEQDREIIDFIEDVVISDLTFSHNWTDDAATTGNNAQGNYLDRHRALAQKLQIASTRVCEMNHISRTDWAVVSPRMAAILAMLPNWEDGEISKGNSMTFYNPGSIKGGLKVYVDPNRTGALASEILTGFKPRETTYGAGVVYSPYCNWMTDKITDPYNFDSIRATFSRYAITATPRAQYNYAKVDVENLF